MGALSGTAEVLGETLSLENIKGLQAGETKGLLRDILRSAGIEGSEEGVTTLLNTFADNIVNGNESDYYVALEGYISQGMSYADAERAAMKDWVNGIAFDMISGAASGGISGGVGGPAVRAADSLMSGRQTFEGDTQGLLDTAAGFKDTKAADLATKYGTKYSAKGSITNRQAGKLGNAIEKATGQQNETNIHSAISAELKARGVTSNTGDLSDAIQKSASGKLLTKEEHYLIRDTPGAREIRDELFDRMTNGKLNSEKLAAEDTPQWLRNIEQKDGAVVAGQAMFGSLQNEAAEQRLTEADRIDTINPEVTIGEVSGKVSGISSSGNTAEITITGKDGTKRNVNLEEAISSGAIPNDVAYLARNAAAFGPVANEVYNLYSPAQTAREYIAAMDAAINTVAANVGSRSAFEQADSVQYLTKEQRDLAWSEGQKQRAQAQEKAGSKQDKGKKKTPPRQGRVSYGGVTYEGRTFKATSADKVKPEVRRVLEKFAAATGVDIVFYESEADQRGDYVGANGFYRSGTVYLDVHAGAKSTSEKEAVLITAAHEFTHFIRENTPRRYNQLKEFVTEHLLENGYDFETLVERKIRAAQDDGGLSRDAAVEEVVADACEMVFADSKAVERLAKEKPGLAKRIADWLHEFFSDIRKAFEGVEARHEEAKAMLDYMDELTKLWDDALVEAAENRGGTQKGSSTKFSYAGRRADGIEVYETSPEVKRLSWKERKKRFSEIMANQYRGRTAKFTRNGHSYYATFDYDDVNKNIYGDNESDQSGRDAKINVGAEGSIFELVENAKYFDFAKETGKAGKAHKDVKYWHYFIKTVQIDGTVFDVLANIRRKSKDSYVYLIELYENKNIEAASPSSDPKPGASTRVPTTSMDSIRNSDQNVKKSRRENDEENLQIKYPHLNLNEDISDLDGIPAIELTDGSVLPIKDHDRYPTHVSFIEGNRIDVDDLRSGGWIGNGVYDPSFTSDTARYIERQQARKRVAERAGKPFQQFRYSRRDSAEGLTKEEARAQAAAYTRLKAENAELQRRVEYWKGQTQRTKQATVRQADVNSFARALIKNYSSTADQAYIRQALQEMGNYLVQNDGQSLDYDQLRQMAMTIAAELVATAEVTEDSGYTSDVAEDILSTIRNADIRLDRQYLHDLPEGFHKAYRGQLHIFTDKGTSVDSLYAELQETYGYDLFPAIDNPADQLVMLGDIFDRMNAPAEVNPRPPRGGRQQKLTNFTENFCALSTVLHDICAFSNEEKRKMALCKLN